MVSGQISKVMVHRTFRCSILTIGDFPEGGATSQRLYLLAKLLNEGFGKTSLWILHPISKVSIPENNLKAGEWGGVPYVYLSGSIHRPHHIWGALTDTMRGIYNSIRMILSNDAKRPDLLVVYTPNFFKFILPIIFAKILRIPIIMEACEINSTTTSAADRSLVRRLSNSGDWLMERIIPRISVGLLAISHGIRQYYVKMGLSFDDIHILPVLIDPERYEKGGLVAFEALRGTRFLLNSGSFSEKDGLEYLVRAMARVHEECPEVKLVFTGNVTKSAEAKILEFAGPKGEDWIIFTGFLSRDELIWCYKNAIGLLCCRSNSDYANYGFPTKLAEYLASERPVIATTAGDVEEYLTDDETAFLAEPENVESITSAILRMLHNPDHAEKIGHQGAAVARQYFDYRQHIEAVSKFIQQRID